MKDTPKDPRGVDEAASNDHTAVTGEVPGRDGGPIDESDMRAADGLEASESTQRAYQDLLEKGREQKGEGRVG